MEFENIINEKKTVEKEKTKVRDCLYGKINVSVKTMDRFIMVMIVMVVISIVLGTIQ